MRRIMLSSHLSFLFRLAVGVTFIYAAVPKITDPFSFSISIRNYQLVFPEWTNIMAIILPWIELYAGILLITGPYIHASARILAILTIIFSIALASALIRGLDIGCGCFSPSDQSDKVSLDRIMQDLLILIMLIQIIHVKVQKFTIESLWFKLKISGS